MRRVLILNVFLLAIIAVLVIQVVALWWGTDAAVDEVVSRKPKVQRVSARNPVRPPAPADLVKNIAEHDLFDASRAAADADAKPAASDTPVRPLTIELLGVRIVGGEREALVKDQGQPKAEWFRPGEEINGHTVGRIEPRAIVMVSPTGDEVTLPINVKYNQQPGGGSLGPAGVQTGVAAQAARAAAPTPAPRRTPSADIREKIERLREEARKRRAARAARTQ
jgi:Type II secretion system protein C